MQPRGQLWFELQRVCKDFRDFSGLGEKEGLELLAIIRGNLRAETEDELKKRVKGGESARLRPEAFRLD